MYHIYQPQGMLKWTHVSSISLINIALVMSLFLKYLYLFIWLCQVLVVACGIFHWGMCSVVEAYRFSCPTACAVLSSLIKPRSPALEGGFLTTKAPGKSTLEISSEPHSSLPFLPYPTYQGPEFYVIIHLLFLCD